MKLLAKYPGYCLRCGARYDTGASIEWERGVGAAHAECAAMPEFRPDQRDVDRLAEIRQNRARVRAEKYLRSKGQL